MDKIEIKNKHFFKSKKQMIIYFILMGILIYLFILVGTTDFSKKIDDNKRFSEEYPLVDEDNVFKYINATDARMVASGKKGIVLFGNSSNIWCKYYAKIVNDVAKEVGIREILYYDFYQDRDQNNGTYEDILNLLKNYVTYNDKGKANIYAPTLLVVSDDNILVFDTETSFVSGKITPEEYWTEYKKGIKTLELSAAFKEYLGVKDGE